MTSEAAQKAYPVNVGPMSSGFVDQLNQSRQEAFDAGAVEALRQAAQMLYGRGSHAEAENVERLADNWEAGK